MIHQDDKLEGPDFKLEPGDEIELEMVVSGQRIIVTIKPEMAKWFPQAFREARQHFVGYESSVKLDFFIFDSDDEGKKKVTGAIDFREVAFWIFRVHKKSETEKYNKLQEAVMQKHLELLQIEAEEKRRGQDWRGDAPESES